MGNWDSNQALEYHRRTRHTPRGVRSGSHTLDWDNKPAPFKQYRDRPTLPLPERTQASERPGWSHVRGEIGSGAPIDRATLSRLCHLSAGVTRSRRMPDGSTHHFRAAACAGALYPTELYVVIGGGENDLPPDGVYHFHPLKRVLTRLRTGDYRPYLAPVVSESEAVLDSTLLVALSAIPWRSSWKYRQRAYRHLFWDSGTILSNLLALSRERGLRPVLCEGFLDEALNRLLGVEPPEEFTVALVPMRDSGPGPGAGEAPEPAPLDPEVEPLSSDPRTYSLIQETYTASRLGTSSELQRWTRRCRVSRDSPSADQPTRPEPWPEQRRRGDGLEEVIRRRGSSRQFRRDPVEAPELAFLLESATSRMPADFEPRARPGWVDCYFTAANVSGLTSGSYYYQPGGGFELLDAAPESEVRNAASHLCLDQRLGGEAAAVVFLLAPLEAVHERLGNRGYRAVQHEAGILLGNLNLMTYAQKLASTGLTFYDDEVTEFFSPHAGGLSPMTVCAIGKEARREGLR